MTDWLATIPLFWGKILAVSAFTGMIVWTWLRPRRFIFQGAPDDAVWRDLRIWATLCLVIQIVIYMSF
ncbi:MAG: hypothetical protein V3U24_10320 [Candidatus Neomarinimicrobiota bacterium]